MTLLQALHDFRKHHRPNAVDPAWAGWLSPVGEAERRLCKGASVEIRPAGVLHDELLASIGALRIRDDDFDVVCRRFGLGQHPEGLEQIGATLCRSVTKQSVNERVERICQDLAGRLERRPATESARLPLVKRLADDPFLAAYAERADERRVAELIRRACGAAAADAYGAGGGRLREGLAALKGAHPPGARTGPATGSLQRQANSRRRMDGVPAAAIAAHRELLALERDRWSGSPRRTRPSGERLALLPPTFLPDPLVAATELNVERRWDPDVFAVAVKAALDARNRPEGARLAAAAVGYADRLAPGPLYQYLARCLAVGVARRTADGRGIPLARHTVAHLRAAIPSAMTPQVMDWTAALTSYAIRNAVLLVSQHDGCAEMADLLCGASHGEISTDVVARNRVFVAMGGKAPAAFVLMGLHMRWARDHLAKWLASERLQELEAMVSETDAACLLGVALAGRLTAEPDPPDPDRILGLNRRLLEVRFVLTNAQQYVCHKDPLRDEIDKRANRVDDLLASTIAAEVPAQFGQADAYQRLLYVMARCDTDIQHGEQAEGRSRLAEASGLMAAAAAYPPLGLRRIGQARALGLDPSAALCDSGMIRGVPRWPHHLRLQAKSEAGLLEMPWATKDPGPK